MVLRLVLVISYVSSTVGASSSSLLTTPSSSVFTRVSTSSILTFSVSTSVKISENVFLRLISLRETAKERNEHHDLRVYPLTPPNTGRPITARGEKLLQCNENYSGRPSSARSDEAGDTKAPRVRKPATDGNPRALFNGENRI